MRIFLLSLCLISCTCTAEIVKMQATGEFLYGPDTSERKACEAAVQKATTTAVRKIYGEKVSVTEQLSCKEEGSREDNTNCVYHSYLWNTIDGEIRSSKLISREIESIDSLSKCTVVLSIEAVRSNEKSDPGFDFKVKLNQNVFRHNDSLNISIQPTDRMYVTVFGWYPYSKTKVVEKIFPNQYDAKNLISELLKIPTESALKKNVSIRVQFPKKTERSFVDEHLIIVASKNPVNWLDAYQFETFKKRLTELRKTEKRVRHVSYRIIRGKI